MEVEGLTDESSEYIVWTLAEDRGNRLANKIQLGVYKKQEGRRKRRWKENVKEPCNVWDFKETGMTEENRNGVRNGNSHNPILIHIKCMKFVFQRTQFKTTSFMVKTFTLNWKKEKNHYFKG